MMKTFFKHAFTATLFTAIAAAAVVPSILILHYDFDLAWFLGWLFFCMWGIILGVEYWMDRD